MEIRINRRLLLDLTASLSIVETDTTHVKFLFELPLKGGEGDVSPLAPRFLPVSRLSTVGRRKTRWDVSRPCFPLDEARTHTHGPAHDQPGAIFHGILLPSAHATPRQNARRRRDASFYLSPIYLPTRSLPNRPRRAHDPAGDRFEKLLIVPFLEGARHILSSCARGINAGLLLPPRGKNPSSRLRLDWPSRGFLEEVRIDGWGHRRRRIERETSSVICSVSNRDGDYRGKLCTIQIKLYDTIKN